MAGSKRRRTSSSLAPALENRELLRRYLHKRYVRLRRWIWKYLEYDAVRRIVRRSSALALRAWPRRRGHAANGAGGKNIGRQAVRYRYREALLKMRRIIRAASASSLAA